MKKHKYLIAIASSMFIILAFIVLFNAFSIRKVTISNGQADFSSYNLNNKNALVGEWEIYFNTLIITDEVDISTLTKETIFVPNHSFKELNDYGFHSYRIVLENVPANNDLAIALDGAFDGYAIYLNGELVSSNYRLKANRVLVALPTAIDKYHHTGGDLEIVIEVSNYTLGFTGLKKAPYLSTNDAFLSDFYLTSGLRLLLFGALLFSVVYLLVVIGLRSGEKSSIYFASFIFLGAISSIFFQSSYSYMFANIFNISIQLSTYLKYPLLYLSTFFLFLTTHSLYDIKKREWTDFIFIITPVLMTIVAVSLYFRTFSINLIYFNILHAILLILLILCSLLRRKKRDYNYYIAMMITIVLIGSIHDTLLAQNLISFGDTLAPYTFLMSVFLYSSITNYMHEQDISSVHEIIELNKKIRDTEFTFLNSQIQSHFIYNTLNSIQSLCITNPIKASELIEEFSMYLRTRLEFNKMPILINIEDELEHIRTYLNIEKERYGNRVRFEYDLKVGDFMVPPLTVQPLVENAVKHGISMKKLGGTIVIATYRDKEAIYIKISDDGLGFDPKSLSVKQRVGTENINHRLNLHLNATLTISSKPNEGTISIIRIPNNG